MDTVRLGRSGLTVNRLAFGALPLQRLSQAEAVALLRRAVDGGIDFFDTARAYTDSERKLGEAFSGMRQKLIIASKSMAADGAAIKADLAVSLAELRTDYLDLYQIHNPKKVPMPGDGTDRYETLAELKRIGTVRAIGVTTHSLRNGLNAARSGLYDTVQFPLSMLSSPEEENLTVVCRDEDVGFIAMKALSGGLIANIPAAFAYTRRFANVAPIWGMQAMAELEEFLRLDAAPPAWDAAMRDEAERERTALGNRFCRGCGYCLPCPREIHLPFALRMSLLLRRSPWRNFATPEWIAKMALAKTCIGCGDCASRCPYGLNPSELLAENVADYEQFMKEKGIEGF